MENMEFSVALTSIWQLVAELINSLMKPSHGLLQKMNQKRRPCQCHGSFGGVITQDGHSFKAFLDTNTEKNLCSA